MPNTKVILAPASIEGNVSNKYLQGVVGFDSSSKVFSQLIGNMLTDCASAVKYWYFMRTSGKYTPALAAECALQTNPNHVMGAFETNGRKWDLA